MSDKNIDFKTLSERYKKEMMSVYANYRPMVRTYGNIKADAETLPDGEQFSQNLQPQQVSPEENIILPMKPDDFEEDNNDGVVADEYENNSQENVDLPLENGNGSLQNDERTPENDKSSLNSEKNDNKKNVGYIKVVVSVAAEAVPIPGAEVTISRGDEKFYTQKYKTDLSGGTPVISVPAPDKENSLDPDSLGTVFYEYRIEVFVEGYERAIIDKVPVFEGVLSLQPISLRPISTVTNENNN